MNGLKQVRRTVTASWQRMTAATAIAIGVWLTFILLYFPQYSYQMVTSDILLFDNTVSSLFWYQYAAGGVTGVLFPAVISALVGVATVVTGVSLLQQMQMRQSLGGSIGATAGFLSAGCASCSAGALALLGFTGGVALLPFNGKGLQVASIGLLLLSLEYAGRNSTCRINDGEML